ncbi:hypothetical protein HHI36_003118 [Cryptolaemus montrouzieri]|uniref:Uncharacterized protein n=1 Tax=Cryptolaemus montrouzieri TaxID=559131 RepID=A0ABD2PD07_9CUCU
MGDALTPTQQPRRRSIYNFFLRHQDAVENEDTSQSPPVPKRNLTTTSQTLHPAMAEEAKPKRGSIIRKKRAGSCKARPTSMLSQAHRAGSEPQNSTDVSILVTEASPDAAITKPSLQRQQSEATIVQVLVHRESEEYQEPVSDVLTPEVRVDQIVSDQGEMMLSDVIVDTAINSNSNVRDS